MELQFKLFRAICIALFEQYSLLYPKQTKLILYITYDVLQYPYSNI